MGIENGPRPEDVQTEGDFEGLASPDVLFTEGEFFKALSSKPDESAPPLPADFYDKLMEKIKDTPQCKPEESDEK